MKNSHITLMMLSAFTAIAEHGSFSRAGDALGLTQSGVSHAMRALEAAIGGRLVARGRDGAELTQLGRQVLKEAHLALAAVHRLHEIGAQRVVVRGRVNVGVVRSASARLAPGALRTLRRDHPEVDVELMEGTDSEIRAWTEGGVAEIGIGGMTGRSLCAELLATDEFMLLAPDGHPLISKSKVALEDLSGTSFIMSEAGCEPAIRAMLRRASVTVLSGPRVRDVGTLVAMVRAGLGLSIVPTLALPVPIAEGVTTRPFTPSEPRRLLMLQRRGRELTPGAGVVRQALLNSAVLALKGKYD